MSQYVGLVHMTIMLIMAATCCVAASAPSPRSSGPASESPAASNDEQNLVKKLLCQYSLPCPGVHTTPSPPPLPPTAIDASLCTHIIISSAILLNTSIIPCSPQDIEVYKEVISLKKQNPSLQVLLRVKGNWTTLTHDPMAVAEFAYNAGQFLQKAGLGGLEVAWHPPSWPWWGSSTRHLSLLLLQLNNAIKLASHPPLLLSVVVSASQQVIDSAYDVRVLNQTVDFVSVATYDFHTYQPYLPFTGYGSPLQPRAAEQGFWATLNTKWAVDYWLRKDLPREKLVITIPLFANTWKLLSSGWHWVGAPAVGLGLLNGYMTYSKVCVFLQGSGQHWDKASRVPYAWRSKEWVSYENEASVKEKAKLVLSERLGGAALLDLNSDDWSGQCPEAATFPLLKAVKTVLSKPMM